MVWSGVTPSFKVTQGHRKRHGYAAYDFLLTFHSNHHGPISYRFCRKMQIFPPPCILRRRWSCSRWKLELGTSASIEKKTRIMGLPGRKRSLAISSLLDVSAAGYGLAPIRLKPARLKNFTPSINGREYCAYYIGNSTKYTECLHPQRISDKIIVFLCLRS